MEKLKERVLALAGAPKQTEENAYFPEEIWLFSREQVQSLCQEFEPLSVGLAFACTQKAWETPEAAMLELAQRLHGESRCRLGIIYLVKCFAVSPETHMQVCKSAD